MSLNNRKIKWYLFRLKTMNIKEIFWRLGNFFINYHEMLKYCSNASSICDIKYGKQHIFNINNLKLNINKKLLNTNYKPKLIANFSYNTYKKAWHYGFNTNNNWPTKPSYKINYKGRDDIGDARINWELNRHHQFTILAKNYYLTNKKEYIDELCYLFNDWNKENPFLFGISWTSPMEIAIRCINWVFTYYFIYYADKNNKILNKLRIGIENMANYVYKHISKYSSANNHTIVELSSVLIVATLTSNVKLINKITSLLTNELEKQNFSDGVNKEQSLHYEAFCLEAISLSAKILQDNDWHIYDWKNIVTKMSNYIANCLDTNGQSIEFGDNDGGYIVRLGEDLNYYKYVINMSNTIFNIPQSLEYTSETLLILLNQKSYIQNFKYDILSSYKDGGITLIRNNNHLIGIDHGPLGLEPIAAHGHADALSFQIILDGKHFLIDPGTYVYHINKEKRNYYRSTINHNTVCINNTNQSKIHGPFLWGKKANTKLISLTNHDGSINLETKHNGYKKEISRTFVYNDNILTIHDNIGNQKGIANFNFGLECTLKVINNHIEIKLNNKTYIIQFNGNILNIKKKIKYYSPKYGIEYNIEAIEVTFKEFLTTSINLRD